MVSDKIPSKRNSDSQALDEHSDSEPSSNKLSSEACRAADPGAQKMSTTALPGSKPGHAESIKSGAESGDLLPPGEKSLTRVAASATDGSIIDELIKDGLKVLEWCHWAAAAPSDKVAPQEAWAKSSMAVDTRINADGSIEFSASAARANKMERSITHDWEANGSHHMECREGCIRLDDKVFTRERIIKQSGNDVCSIDKQCHSIEEINEAGSFSQKESSGKLERKLSLSGDSCSIRHSNGLWAIVDDTTERQIGSLNSQGVEINCTSKSTLTLTKPGLSAEQALLSTPSNHGIFADQHGNLSARLKDGTHMSYFTGDKELGDYVLLKKDHTELFISADGKHLRLRQRDGQWSEIKPEEIPESLRKRVAAFQVRLDDEQTLDLRERQLFSSIGGSHKHIHWHCDKNKTSILHLKNGLQAQVKDGHLELANPGTPGQKPLTWDAEKQELSSAVGVMTADRFVARNGDEIYVSGLVRWKNRDGSFDEVDRDGNYKGHDGTTIDRNLNGQTSDGQRIDGGIIRGDASSIGSPAHASAEADRAFGVAANIVGKAIIGYDDVESLVNESSNLAMLIATCMSRGDMNSVTRLMAAQAQVEGTLTFALSRAQACTIARQMGIFSAHLIQEMQENLYGKTPWQAARQEQRKSAPSQAP